jgi:hypothetical protein
MKLICTNSECENESDDGVFDVHVTVHSDGSLAEEINSIEGHEFTCCFCHEPAKRVKNDLTNTVETV